jgi:predicted ATPase
MLGHPDQSLQRNIEALSLSQKLSHPHSQAFALNFAAELHQFRREDQAAQERAEEAITLSTEQGFPYWLAWGTILRGWTLAEQGFGVEGIAQMRQGLADYWGTGGEVRRPHFFTLLAEGYGKIGQAKEGLTVLAEALALVDQTGERYWEAELYRLCGELTFAQSSVQSLESGVQKNQKSETTDPRSLTPDPQAEAEACFLKAIDIAQKQQAKSLELRAVMSLARLWRQQGKQAEAHKLLSAVYNWFTEGFDTKDLQEAKALLAELALVKI